MKEEAILLAKLKDLDSQAESYYQLTFSWFLTTYEQDILQRNRGLFSCSFQIYGGNSLAERQIAIFIPYGLSLDQMEAVPISCLCITPKQEKFAEQLSHRDYLGAILNTGIERSRIGDIFVNGKSAYFFCLSSMKDYLIENITRIKHTSVTLAEASGDDLIQELQVTKHSDTIISPRLDVIIASIMNLSREKSQQLITKELVSVNSRLTVRPDYQCKDLQVISIRGYGKARIIQIGQQTKKGKLKFSYEKFV